MLCCVVLYCIVLYCIVLYCIVLLGFRFKISDNNSNNNNNNNNNNNMTLFNEGNIIYWLPSSLQYGPQLTVHNTGISLLLAG